MELLRWSAEQKIRLPVSGRQRVTLWTDEGTEVTISQEYRNGRGRSRTEVLRPEARRGLLMLEEGHERWVYDPGTRSMIHSTTVADAEPVADLDLIARNYQVHVGQRVGTVARRAAWRVTIRSPEPGKPERRSWIDAETGYPLKVEQLHPDGTPQSVGEWESIDYSPSLPEGLFDRPAGKVREARSLGAETPVRPEAAREALGLAPESALAGGYQLRDVTRIGQGSAAVYHYRYHDGISVVSLFLSRAREPLASLEGTDRLSLPDGQAGLHVDSHLHTLRWRSGPLSAALVGDASTPLLTALAASTGCARQATAHELPVPFIDRWILLLAVVCATAVLVWAFTWTLGRRQSAA